MPAPPSPPRESSTPPPPSPQHEQERGHGRPLPRLALETDDGTQRPLSFATDDAPTLEAYRARQDTPAAATADDTSDDAASDVTGAGEHHARNASTLALRDNTDPEGTRRAREAHNYAQHHRRVSDAPSSVSTVPDTHGQHLAVSGAGDSPTSATARSDGARSSNVATTMTAVGDEAVTLEGVGPHAKAEIEKQHEQHAQEDAEPRERRLCGLLPPKKEKELVLKAKPDPTPDEMPPFPTDLTPSSLYALIDPKNVAHLRSLGGTQALLRGLGSDPKHGIVSDATAAPSSAISLDDRVRVYGVNRVPERKSKSLLELMWLAYQDKVLLILSVAAIVSLALGLYQDLGTPPDTYQSTSCPNNTCVQPQVDWVEGVAITVAIFIVVIVGSLNDYQKERQFRKLNAQKEERSVKCIRDGTERLMSVYDVVVGDVCILEPGEIVPVDGIFLAGHNVRCDESGATGESDAMKKASYDDLVRDSGGDLDGKLKADPFLLSGSKVLEGVGTYLVTGVGERSFHGKIMMSLRGDGENTPLQLKLNRLAELIAKLGSAAGGLLFGALMIRFFVALGTDPDRSANDKAQNFIQILIIAVTVVVVAVPEGLPLAVTLALAFATRRMTKQNLLVRVLGACETMANATVICTDKTGTLTENRMSVVAGTIGVHLKFADRLAENRQRSNANADLEEEAEDVDGVKEDEEKLSTPPPSPSRRRRGRLDFSCDMANVNEHLSPPLRELLNQSISINSTAFEGTDEHGNQGTFVGSKTETALLTFARGLEWDDYKRVRDGADVVQMVPFSSDRKSMGVVIKHGKGYRILLKGASEVLAKLCTRHVVVDENVSTGDELKVHDFTDETRANISRSIIFYANQSLRTIALCSADVPVWPPPGAKVDAQGEVSYEDFARDLTLVAITAIEDPLREGVSKSVATCQKAGVAVKMVTGDNVLTARSIATQCGIFSPGGVIMEGPVFRNLSQSERAEIVPRLQVLARSSPDDKRILVEQLKDLGEVVAASGDGANDGPALKTANIGFAMGIAGTEIAKEASDIILMDDNFASMVSAIMWGRCVNDAVKKFLQFQLSVNVTAVIITFVTAVASDEEESVLTAVQLLWVNLIMDTFAALALATDPATPDLLDRKPDRRNQPLVTPSMWMHILGQAVFQITVALVLHFAGPTILNLHAEDPALRIDQENQLSTLVFNTFVFCQIFNQFNARRLDRKFNVFSNVHRNPWFICIFFIMVGGQALIVNVGGAAFQVTRIPGTYWAISIVIGFFSLPIGALIRLLPVEPWERFLIKIRMYPDPNATVLPVVTPKAAEEEWNEGIAKVVDNLTVFGQIRGGRMRASSIVRRSRTKQLAQHDIHPTSLMAMVPAMVMSGIGGGKILRSEGTLSDPASADPSRSSSALFAGQTQVHPDTNADDPLMKRFNAAKPGSSTGPPPSPSSAYRTHNRGPSNATMSSTGGGHSRSSSLAVPGQQPFRGDQSLSPPSPTKR